MKTRLVGSAVVACVVLVGLGCGEAMKSEAPPVSNAKVDVASKDAPPEKMMRGTTHKEAYFERVGLDFDQQPAPVVRKVIYTATLKMEVEDFPKAAEELERLIEEHKAILEHTDITGGAAVPAQATGRSASLRRSGPPSNEPSPS